MEATDEGRIISKIRKLLALANDQAATAGERENALRMAHLFLAKHNLDMATVEATQGVGTTAGEERIETGNSFYGRPWARQVCGSVARLFFCRYLFVPAGNAKHTVHCFIGRKSNSVTAGELSRFVVESILKEGRRRQRELVASSSWRRSFCLGAAHSIMERVEEMLEEAKKPVAPPPEAAAEACKPKAPGTALVLASVYEMESQANKALIEKRYPKLRSGRMGAAPTSGMALVEGKAYGRTVQLRPQVGDTRVKGLIK